MLFRPQAMPVPVDVVCPFCGVLLLAKGEIAHITLRGLHEDSARLAQLMCICEDCEFPVLIGYMPASHFGIS
jgi:hypothetical protein